MKTKYCICATEKEALVSGITTLVLAKSDYVHTQRWTTCDISIIRKLASKKVAEDVIKMEELFVGTRFKRVWVATAEETKEILRKQDEILTNAAKGRFSA